MPLTDLWRVKGWKLIEHWDEFNLLGIPANRHGDR
jgi:hypothetical protein